ncbi:membrane-bound lytic murein transglycosylase F [Modicisalibacter ilicicola DSM 19980]|uniref:Membrane-bound lytic murein transglycosylase F n=1 Tax=Modicisalibacter ilicicola DSM 19980 TaxID=1121942 RepID=A0A1M4USI2_9GAMM|nr:membrane-bound lytic murein transglycosylase MltF [Halomonas ilicicola]SHE59628.1 membrane-bound lytic murein transglycosylase F [Halomonas ilicicola DSM 19980]
MYKSFARDPRWWRIPLIILVLTLVPDLSWKSGDPLLKKIRTRDFLQVITRNTPTTYYQGRQGPTGFEFELVRRFADHLGVSLAIDTTESIDDVLTIVRQGDADLGAAALPMGPIPSGIHYSRPILELQPLVVYRRDLPPVRDPEDLIGRKVGVIRHSGASQALRELQRQLPELGWRESTGVEVADLLHMIENGELDAAVIYAHQFKLNRLFYPGVEDGFTLGESLSLVWAVPASEGLGLLREVNRFLDKLRRENILHDLVDRYFGHDDYLEYVGARLFIRHVQKRLPQYESAFKEAARRTGIDWKLLAALGYQESHWKPRATSPTGVRGLMMLTQPTAKQMGIKNRLDPLQSIDGGSRYLVSVKERLQPEIREPDRTWMALAAYNVGLGHLYDAQKIAEIRGGDPYSWADVRDSLPLLQKREWYSKGNYGYARGGEPVIYVRNIRRYYEILNYVSRSQQQFYQLNQRSPNAQEESQLFDIVPPVL